MSASPALRGASFQLARGAALTKILLGDFAKMVGGELHHTPPYDLIAGFATDSRAVKPGDLFLAIRGENVDGHEYASGALARGAIAVLAERPITGPHVRVVNLVEALAKMASHFRQTFSGPVVGITGSAGKTTTKEFLASALSPLGPVLKNEGNRNTEFTSPLVWAELLPEHRAAVVEMGMRGFGQVAHLASFSKPTIGVVTNIGHSHIELVGSREGIAQAKGELLDALPADGWAVLWAEDFGFDLLASRAKRFQTFGYGESATCRILHYRATSWNSSVVEGTLDGEHWEAHMPVMGRHLALNAAAAVLAASLAGVPPKDAASQIVDATLPPMRMEVLDVDGVAIMLDAYNASPASMIGAIETLCELPVTGRRRAVIGEMRELGDESVAGHEEVGRAIAASRLSDVVLYREPTLATRRAAIEAGYPEERIRIAQSLADITDFLRESVPGDAVLVKGSRALELEKALVPLGVKVAQ